jgi:hypothetical protein
MTPATHGAGSEQSDNEKRIVRCPHEAAFDAWTTGSCDGRRTSSRNSGATWHGWHLVHEQISSIEKTRAERLERAPDRGAHAMVRLLPRVIGMKAPSLRRPDARIPGLVAR